jgi:hypothetical protein
LKDEKVEVVFYKVLQENKPLISVVTPVYNQEKIIVKNRLLYKNSIQNLQIKNNHYNRFAKTLPKHLVGLTDEPDKNKEGLVKKT